jgi:predicted PurR-regulated permease PerM
MSTVSPKDARYFLIALLLLFLGLTLLLFSGFAGPVILGLVLAGLSYKGYLWLLRKIRSKNVAALITMIAVVLVIIIPLTFLGTALFFQALELLSATQNRLALFEYPTMQAIEEWAAQYNIDIRETLQQLTPSLKSLGLYISRQVGNIFSNVAAFVLDFFVMLVTLFYFLRDGDRIGKLLIEVSPLKTADERHLYRTFQKVNGAIFFGTFVSALVQGVLGGLGFAFFGIGAPVLWGTIMGFLALFPILGPFIIFLPAAVYLYATGPLSATIIFLIYNILIVSGIDNLIKPKLIGDKVNIHPLLILISILGGLKVFGLMGLVYGPLIVAILITVIHLYRSDGHSNSATAQL